MPGAAPLNEGLIEKLRSEGSIKSPSIEAAFQAVPRHVFVPGVPLAEAYQNQYIVTKSANGEPLSSSSQPSIMALMLEQLALEPGHRVLEIGTGTGYNAALMAHIVGETGRVITMDLDEDIVENAHAHLEAAGFGRVHVVRGDGGFGYPDAAPYDRIILTVGAWDIAPAWRDQLRPDGRLVLPLSVGGSQRSVAFEPAEAHLVSASMRDCVFIPLRGAFAAPNTRVPLGPEPGLYFWPKDPGAADAEAVYTLLRGPSRDTPASVRVTPREVHGGFILRLALREPGFFWLRAEQPLADRGLAPYLFGLRGQFCSTAGLLQGRSTCLLMRAPDSSPAADPSEADRLFDLPFDLFIRSFGNATALVARVLDHLAAWDAAGRPATRGLRIRAYPIDTDYTPEASEFVVPKRWTRLVLDRP